MRSWSRQSPGSLEMFIPGFHCVTLESPKCSLQNCSAAESPQIPWPALAGSTLPAWCPAQHLFASRFFREADSRVPRVPWASLLSKVKCRQEERQGHKTWMKLDYFPLKYLRELGEGAEQGRQQRQLEGEGGVRIHSCGRTGKRRGRRGRERERRMM